MTNNLTPLATCLLNTLKAIDVNDLALNNSVNIDDAIDTITRVVNDNLTLSHIIEIERVSSPFFTEKHEFFGLQCLLAYFAKEHKLFSHFETIAAIEDAPLNEEYEFEDNLDIGKRIYDGLSHDIIHSVHRYFSVNLSFHTGDIIVPHLICVSTVDDTENLDVRAAATLRSGSANNDNDVAGFESGAGQIYVPVSVDEITYYQFFTATKALNVEHYASSDLVPNDNYEVSMYLGM
jgi:hypothetical protein